MLNLPRCLPKGLWDGDDVYSEPDFSRGCFDINSDDTRYVKKRSVLRPSSILTLGKQRNSPNDCISEVSL